MAHLPPGQDCRPTAVGRRRLGRVALIAGAAALVYSARLPYWHTRVSAPQYPKGLTLVVYPDRIAGDVREIDSLNHYIGMRPLEQGAWLERRIAIPGLMLAALAVVIAAFVSFRWAWMLSVPALILPSLFAVDLYLWMRHFGLDLDPHAPLNRSVKPFIPTILGQGKIAQFQSVAWFGAGFCLALIAGALILFGLWCRFWKSKTHATTVLGFSLLLLTGVPSADARTLVVAPDHEFSTPQAAMAAAAPGDTVVVRGGMHRGPLQITVPVTLIGEEGAVIDGGGTGTVITVTAPGTVVRGLTIRRSGDVLSHEDAGLIIAAARVVVEDNRFEDVLFGITLSRAPGTVVRRNTFKGKALPVARRGDLIRVWYSDDVTLEANRAMDGRDIVLWFSQRIRVEGNDVQRGRYGLHFMYCNDAVVQDNRLTDNSVGMYLMYSTSLVLRGNRMVHNRGPSGYGLGLKDMEQTRAEDNIIAENRVGIFMEHATGLFTRNVISHNEVGVHLFPTARDNVLTANSFIDNGEQVFADGAPDRIRNRWEGNFWSDYRGFDANGDGVGDIPYRTMRLFEQLTDRYPAFRLYAGSPAAQALDVAARVFPMFAPRPKLEDTMPRMRPVPPVMAGSGRGVP